MKANDAFPGAHLKWEDLEKGPARLTIVSVAMGEVGQGSDKDVKPIVTFRNTERTLVLNKTNFNRIAAVTHQPDTDQWGGHQITLAKDTTEFQGKPVNCIRVQMVPEPVAPAAPAEAPAEPLGSPVLTGNDAAPLGIDEIPF